MRVQQKMKKKNANDHIAIGFYFELDLLKK